MGLFSTRQTPPTARETQMTSISSCFATLLARSLSPAPRAWEVTMAPPVAKAEKSWMIRLLM